ncbi:MAG: hypothetical protein LBR16_07020 [Treponema sp.]|nr:hypothetical protein [Treponema sp.]
MMKNKPRMPRLLALAAALFAYVSLGSCASLKEYEAYRQLANAQSFGDFFPEAEFAKTFGGIAEAEAYLRAAEIKLARAITPKSYEKGLGARAFGDTLGYDEANDEALVICDLSASDGRTSIPVSHLTPDQLEKALDSAGGSVFWSVVVFYKGRIFSLTNYYLDKNRWAGYTNGNVQIETFRLGENQYRLVYPIGWGLKKGFAYLRGELP